MSTDRKEWCNLGLLDYLAPMIDQMDNTRLRVIAEETLQLIAPSRVPVYIGLRTHLIDRKLISHDLPNQLAEQIAIKREMKAHGQVFYHMGGVTVEPDVGAVVMDEVKHLPIPGLKEFLQNPGLSISPSWVPQSSAKDTMSGLASRTFPT